METQNKLNCKFDFLMSHFRVQVDIFLKRNLSKRHYNGDTYALKIAGNMASGYHFGVHKVRPLAVAAVVFLTLYNLRRGDSSYHSSRNSSNSSSSRVSQLGGSGPSCKCTTGRQNQDRSRLLTNHRRS